MVAVLAASLALAAQPVPILEYHVIADPPRTAPYPQLYVLADALASTTRLSGG